MDSRNRTPNRAERIERNSKYGNWTEWLSVKELDGLSFIKHLIEIGYINEQESSGQVAAEVEMLEALLIA